MHLHDFFGTAPGMDATYDSLRAGDTKCFLAEETAGYWAPALYTRDAAGKYLHRLPVQVHVYYSGPMRGGVEVHPFPPNLKMLAGNPEAPPRSQPTNVVWFDCGPGEGPWSKPSQTPYLCPAGKHVRSHIRFPSCWDGTPPATTGDDSAHMAYLSGGGCPAGWVRVPQIHMSISYAIRDGRGARLASGGGPGNPNSIYTLHADYFHAWDQTVFTELVDGCLNGAGGPCGTPRTPVVSKISPGSGPSGTTVTLTGKYFDGVQAVAFGGTAAPFARTSSTSIRCVVPPGAADGRISVTSDGGTTGGKISTAGYSLTSFNVT